MAGDFGQYPGLPPRLDQGIGPVRPGNGGAISPVGPQVRDPFGFPIPGGDRVVPIPGGSVGPHNPPPPVLPERDR